MHSRAELSSERSAHPKGGLKQPNGLRTKPGVVGDALLIEVDHQRRRTFDVNLLGPGSALQRRENEHSKCDEKHPFREEHHLQMAGNNMKRPRCQAEIDKSVANVSSQECRVHPALAS